MDVDELKKRLQEHLTNGLMLVVGSGVSLDEGIPGMAGLTDYLRTDLAGRLAGDDIKLWNGVEQRLAAGDGLEKALNSVEISATLVEAITESTARCLSDSERQVVAEVITGGRVLPMQRLLSHLFKVGKEFHALTPNYDRLIEVSAEISGIGVDARFFGYTCARMDGKRSRDAHRESRYEGKTLVLTDRQRLCVYKPHGSLDWYLHNGQAMRCPFDIGITPLIITPGLSKYREGYAAHFDDQRTAANSTLRRSTRLLFLGYGFNDDHLEQHLCPKLVLQKPSVIVARSMSPNAIAVVQNSEDCIGLCRGSNDNETDVHLRGKSVIVIPEPLWSLRHFVKGVI